MDPKPKWWMLDPINENGNRKMFRHHMEALYNKANKDLCNTQIHWSCNIQNANASMHLKMLLRSVANTQTTTFTNWQAVAE